MSVHTLRLGVNIDHVATVRNARGGSHPDPVRAAVAAEAAGADGITAHLREDRRHIRDADVGAIREAVSIPLNFEMAATEEMVAIALATMPNAACIVPERREEVTTEGGWLSQVAKPNSCRFWLRFVKPVSACHSSSNPARLKFEPQHPLALISSNCILGGIAMTKLADSRNCSAYSRLLF